MKSIWKFPLKVIDEQLVELPDGAQLLTVQTQRETPCLWAIVDTQADIKPCVVQIYGTGHPIVDVGTYISTFQMQGGALVFHVFIKQ